MRTPALSRKKELRIVGIMNGTSLDGVDYVLCKITKNKTKISITFISQQFAEFDIDFRARLKKAADHQTKLDQTAELHHDLGRLYAEQLKKIAQKKKWKFDAIGLHGQTVFHKAPEATLQIGEASYLSAHFKVPVIADFRVADLAVGGQGAPVASLFHRVAFQSKFPNQWISLHNLGGISNFSLLDSKGHVEKSFDTGPANMLMDLMISKVSKGQIHFDEDGQFASKGLPAQSVVESALKTTEFFAKAPPKSCGREEFGDQYLNQLESKMGPLIPEDKMATLAELSARSIAQAYKDFSKKIPQFIILCGGGAMNAYLKKRIQYHLPKSQVMTTEDCGWPVSSIEGAAFALLAAFRIWELPNNLPKTTGAKKSVTMGKISEAF